MFPNCSRNATFHLWCEAHPEETKQAVCCCAAFLPSSLKQAVNVRVHSCSTRGQGHESLAVRQERLVEVSPCQQEVVLDGCQL